MAKEYIEREAAVKKIREWFWSAPGVHPKLDRDAAEEILFAIPAADVAPVVRCRECKYHEPFIICGAPSGMMVCRKLHQKETPDDWFCAGGEKRETEPQMCDTCRHGAHWDSVVICDRDGQRHKRTDSCEDGEYAADRH